MKRSLWRAIAPPAALAALVAATAACTTNPATGRSDFTPFMTPAQEAAVGRKEHPKLLAEYGGAYVERAALGSYVEEIGRRLQGVSEVRQPPFTFTIVNSDEVNAFALPGGYVYVTRGLMALANSEAELAGVVAHEIGHVTARHTAQRYNRALFAQLGAQLGAAALGGGKDGGIAGDLAQLGAALYVQGFSRDQEREADQLGIRYLRRAGYDPWAMVSFLNVMQAESALAATIAGRERGAAGAGLFASHPRTADRVAGAARAARGGQTGLRLGGDEYLLRLDGTLFGDDPEQGLRLGRVFAHPVLRFRFEAPPGFRMRNTSAAVVARHPNGATVGFDGDELERDTTMERYLAREWPKGVALGRIERITVNGMDAATGAARVSTRQGARDVRAVAIRFDDTRVYRFLMLTPPRLTGTLSEGLRRMTYSVRRLGEREAAALKPLRLRIHEVAPGDTVESLAATLPFDDFQIERFRALNGLAPGDHLAPGRLVKLIAE